MSLGAFRFPLAFVTSAVLSFLSITNPAYAQAQAAGGFVSSATDVGLRAPLSAGQVQTFLPARGVFSFPAPYNTTGVRLTNASDCAGSGDCVVPVGYSYWSNINNHVGSDTMLVFLGLERRNGGGGPTLFSYNKRTGETRNMGPLFDANSPYSWFNGEGWYFSASRPNALYMFSGSQIMRYDVIARTVETVFDAAQRIGPNRIVWQVHSSNDDRVHSATIRDGSSYEMLGCAVYREDTQQTSFFAKRGDYDECQIDKGGRWLVIKENVDNANNEDNRVIDLQTGAETVIWDQNGAAGHSDMGYGYIVGEDDKYNAPGAVRVWQFGSDPSAAPLVYRTAQWDGGLGHVAHGNAQPGAFTSQMACSSNAYRQNLPRINEIVCYRMDGSMNVLVVAPNMTDLNASGGGSDDYMKRPKGNLDVTGEYFIWTANAGTSRTDAFIVRIPVQNLGMAPSSPTPAPPVAFTPAPTPAPSPAPAPVAPSPAPGTPAPSGGDVVRWKSMVNVVATGNGLQKSGGCSGCPDAGAASEQQILGGNGSVTFTAPDSASLRFVGLSAANNGTDPAEMRFALRLQGSVAEVRESAAYRTETFFSPGDTFRIAVQGGVVTYAKNGAVFYTGPTAAPASLVVDTTFFDANSSIANVVVAGSGGASTGGAPTTGAPPVAAPAPAPGRRVRWPPRR